MQKITLRPYQIEAVDAVAKAFKEGKKRVLLELGTGSGKSFIAALMATKAVENGNRVLVLCHQKEVLAQNLNALRLISPGITGGIFCDGLKQKCLDAQVVFAHRDSFANLKEMPEFKFAIIDEAHLVSQKKSSKYQKIFEQIRLCFAVGLSATPYRLSGGCIYGKNKPFEIRAFRMGISELIQNKYLSEYDVVECDPQIVANSKRALDYEALGAKAAQDKTIENSARLIKEHTANKMCTIIFCCSRTHAKRLQEHLPGARYIDANTSHANREKLVKDLKEGKIKYVVNVNVLTTGVDIPICDSIVMLRPTLSASLYVQAIGRALRIHPEKRKALIIEMTDNLSRFGNITDPMQFGRDSEDELDDLLLDGETNYKSCPECGESIVAQKRVCPFCDYLFIKPREVDCKIKETLYVIDFNYRPEKTKKGVPCFIVDWYTNRGKITEWLNVNNHNPWVAQQDRAKLRRIRKGQISQIIVQGMTEQYPRVLSYHS